MRKTFKAHGNFEAFYAAEKWLRENGYSVGSMERDAPIGIAKGDCYISKWRNLGNDKTLLDGVIVEGDKRDGDVTIIIFDEADPQGTYRQDDQIALSNNAKKENYGRTNKQP